MIGGDPQTGGLRGKDIVVRYEHHACGVQRVAARLFFSAAEERARSSLEEAPDYSSLEIHAYMGYATNESAVRKAKVHIGFTWSFWIAGSDMAAIPAGGSIDDAGVGTVHSACDVQEVFRASAKEAKAIFAKQMTSVSVPVWAEPPPEHIFRVCVTILDSAADNVRAVTDFTDEIRDCPRTALLPEF
eukprot:3885663-Pyramimonas_sp.AAC.1